MSATSVDRLRRLARRQLDPRETEQGLSSTNKVLCTVILAAVASAIIETEPTIASHHERLFRSSELFFGAVFVVELILRGWRAADGASTPQASWRSRALWLFSLPTLIDILALAPTLFATGATPAFGLRLLRLLRILRIARLGRFSHAWTVLGKAIASRRDELFLTLAAALLVMLVSATALYIVEGAVQPQKFGSIPRALWWALVTLTTIGYGDVTPVTPLGKVLAGITAFVGVGLIAAPTGILAAAFSEAAHRRPSQDVLISPRTTPSTPPQA